MSTFLSNFQPVSCFCWKQVLKPWSAQHIGADYWNWNSQHSTCDHRREWCEWVTSYGFKSWKSTCMNQCCINFHNPSKYRTTMLICLSSHYFWPISFHFFFLWLRRLFAVHNHNMMSSNWSSAEPCSHAQHKRWKTVLLTPTLTANAQNALNVQCHHRNMS